MYCIKHIFPNNTLLVFINLQYENLGFELVKERLIELGYPKEISNIKYKPSFPVSMKVFYDYNEMYQHRFVGCGGIISMVICSKLTGLEIFSSLSMG